MVKKCLLRSLVAVFALALPLAAELPPSAYEQMQREAPDILRIRTLKVEAGPGAAPEITDVAIVAEVLKVGRSRSGVKPGDLVTIVYKVTQRPPKWVGPGEVPLLPADHESVAYLRKIEGAPDFAPAAGVMSFSSF
jgi:hypothetical protein